MAVQYSVSVVIFGIRIQTNLILALDSNRLCGLLTPSTKSLYPDEPTSGTRVRHALLRTQHRDVMQRRLTLFRNGAPKTWLQFRKNLSVWRTCATPNWHLICRSGNNNASGCSNNFRKRLTELKQGKNSNWMQMSIVFLLTLPDILGGCERNDIAARNLNWIRCDW